MRRTFLLLAAIGIPALVWAAASAPSGGFIEVDQYDSTIPASYINAVQCAGTQNLSVEWSSPAAVTTGGNYKIFASSAAPYSSGTNSGYCAEVNDTNNNIAAGLVNTYTATSQIQDQSDLSGATAVSRAGQSCTEGAILYLCAHYYNASATRTAIAFGKFIVQVTAPGAPTGVAVNPGDSKLEVSWTPNGSTPVLTDHYVARAFQPGGTTPVATATTNKGGTTATIKGLANGTTYEVDVVAYSAGGNPSPPSSPRLSAAPVPTADFWTVYRADGGQEQGGCGAGAGGALSLLGVAALVALRRRKP